MNNYKINYGKKVQIIKVIRTSIAKNDKNRPLIQYWSIDGDLLAEEMNFQTSPIETNG